MREPAIVASVLGADDARLGQEVAELEAAGVDRIQWDIMDGRVVPNLSFSADVVGACRGHATVPLEAHLMVEDPDPWLQPFAGVGCGTVLVPAEACRHPHRTLSRHPVAGHPVRVALNPATPAESRPPRPRPGRHAPDHDREPRLRRPGLPPDHEAQGRRGLPPHRALRAVHPHRGRRRHLGRDRAGRGAAGAQLLVAGSAILAHPEARPAAVAELRRCLRPDLQAPPDGRAELESDTHATGGISGNPRDG